MRERRGRVSLGKKGEETEERNKNKREKEEITNKKERLTLVNI